MRIARYTIQFKKDVKRASKRGHKMKRLYTVMKTLESEEVLDARYKEHALLGDYKGYLE